MPALAYVYIAMIINIYHGEVATPNLLPGRVKLGPAYFPF